MPHYASMLNQSCQKRKALGGKAVMNGVSKLGTASDMTG